MKKNIHPKVSKKKIICSCKSSLELETTFDKGKELHVNTCSSCHPFYTGKDSGSIRQGRAEKFDQKHGKLA